MAVWFCEMDFNCHKQWEELNTTSSHLVRSCEWCGKPVYFVDSPEDLEAAAAKGQCVAFYSQDKDNFTNEERQELRKTWQPSSLRGRHTMGLPSRPIDKKLKAFIDKM